jgi:hypothetical protein
MPPLRLTAFSFLFLCALNGTAQSIAPLTIHAKVQTVWSVKAGFASGLIINYHTPVFSKSWVEQAFHPRPVLGIQFDRFRPGKKCSFGASLHLLWHSFRYIPNEVAGCYVGETFTLVHEDYNLFQLQGNANLSWRIADLIGFRMGLGLMTCIGSNSSRTVLPVNQTTGARTQYDPYGRAQMSPLMLTSSLGFFFPFHKVCLEINAGPGLGSYSFFASTQLWLYQATLAFKL